jgi:hypothetical protein
MSELHPGIWFTLWARKRRSDSLERNDSFDTQEVAQEFADELVRHHDYDRAEVRDVKGTTVYGIDKRRGRS